MAKGSGDLPSGRRTHRAKPYDAGNSFVKKVATKVTDLIPQRSWISKWFNTSQDNGEVLSDTDNAEYNEADESIQSPPNKRPCIRMDVTHPPGTFNIQRRNKISTKEQFNSHDDTSEDFLEPPTAGPSGIRRFVASTPAMPSIQTDLNSLPTSQNNGRDDDNSESSESTSGCSSLIPQNNRQEAPSNISYNSPFALKKRFIDDKFSFTNHLQSPRCLFLDNTSTRDTLSNRRPSFNASIANNSMDRSISSPFYSGNTTFGGANAANLYKRNRTLFNNSGTLELKVPRRTSVQVTPSTSSIDTTGMSQTAKRILEALEQFSSPISDAKKIPVNNLNNTILSTPNNKRSRDESSPNSRIGMRHMTRELSVPTVPDLLRIRRRQKLQDTTVAARKISDRNVPISEPQEYQLRTDDTNDMKSQRTLKARMKTNLEEEETVESVNLPNIALPITSLPKFDIALPPYTKPTNKAIDKQASFKFASPIKVTDGAKNFQSINHFTFSNPINANSFKSSDDSNELSKTSSIHSSDSSFNRSSSNAMTIPNFIWTESSNLAIKPKEKKEGPNVTKQLKSGSVMDILGKMPLQNKGNVWECNECLIKNNNGEAQCVACKASKPSVSISKSTVTITINNDESKETSDNKTDRLNCVECKSPSVGSQKRSINETNSSGSKKFASDTTISDSSASFKSDLEKFQSPKNSWECPCCMVRNSEATTTCPCCNTSKPGGTVNETKKVNESSIGFGDKFKKAAGTWSCETCMVQNKPESGKCVACESPRPNGFGDKFKKPEGTWSCTSCMVQNKSDSIKCVACETAKAGSFGNKFKKPEGSWSCDTCMVQNTSAAVKCVACETIKPGSKPSAQNTGGSKLQFSFGMPSNDSGFKFGIDKAEEKERIAPANGFTFGMNSQGAETPSFSFGIPKDFKETQKVSTSSDSEKGSKTVLPTVQQDEKKATFSYGVQKSPDTKGFSFGVATTSTSTPGFTFGKLTTIDSVKKETVMSNKNSSDGTSFLKNDNGAKFPAIINAEKGSNPPSFLTNTTTESNPVLPLAFKAPSVIPTKTETPASNSSTQFSFTSQMTNATSKDSKLPSFGSPKNAVPPTPTFSFGATKPVELVPAAEEKTPAMSFFKPNPAPSFGSSIFGNAESTPKFAPPENKASVFDNVRKTFGESGETKVSTFGPSENKSPTTFPNTTTVLSSSATTTATPFGSTTNIFGSSAPSFGASTSPGIFASKSETTPTPAQTPTQASAPTPAPGLFSFGAAQPATAPAGGTGFNFSAGSNASGTMDQKPLFSFGAGSNAVAPGNGFGNGSFSAPAAPSTGTLNFSFNAPKTEASSFGQANAGGNSLFGAAQQTPTPTPSFQTSVPATGNFNFTPPTPSGGFNFGTAAPSAPGGFNFNVAGATPAVSFDPAARPSFNFTGGAVPAFNAAPAAATSMPGRKIKKAVRRVNQR